MINAVGLDNRLLLSCVAESAKGIVFRRLFEVSTVPIGRVIVVEECGQANESVSRGGFQLSVLDRTYIRGVSS